MSDAVQSVNLAGSKAKSYKKTLLELDLLHSNSFRFVPVAVATVGMFPGLSALNHYRRHLRITGASFLGPAYMVQGVSLVCCYVLWRPFTRKFAVEHQGGAYSGIYAGLQAVAITVPSVLLASTFLAAFLVGFQSRNSAPDFRKAIAPPTMAQKGLVGKFCFWASHTRKLGSIFYLCSTLTLAASFSAGFYQYYRVEEAIKQKYHGVKS